MVSNSGAAGRTGAVRLLRLPEPVRVRLASNSIPSSVLLRRQWRQAVALEERWRIDDEWWTSSPISRIYYRLRFEDGTALTVFQDLTTQEWYTQRT